MHSSRGLPLEAFCWGSGTVSTDDNRRSPEVPVSTRYVIDGLTNIGVGNANGNAGEGLIHGSEGLRLRACVHRDGRSIHRIDHHHRSARLRGVLR